MQRPSRSYGLLLLVGMWTGFYSLNLRAPTLSSRYSISGITVPIVTGHSIRNSGNLCLLMPDTSLSFSSTDYADSRSNLQREIIELKELTEMQETKVTLLKKQLEDNRLARQSLQAEMVVLREGYSNRLAELEDALEQSDREKIQLKEMKQDSLKEDDLYLPVKDMPDQGTNDLVLRSQLLEEYQSRMLKAEAALLESQLVAEGSGQREQEIVTNYTSLRAELNQLLEEYQNRLQKAEMALEERNKALAAQEQEVQSVSKLLWAAFKLIRKRLTQRLNLKWRKSPNAHKTIQDGGLEM